VVRCMNCSSSTHEIEDCAVDTSQRDEVDVVTEATEAMHQEDEKWRTHGT
jgi:hypothetical protein